MHCRPNYRTNCQLDEFEIAMRDDPPPTFSPAWVWLGAIAFCVIAWTVGLVVVTYVLGQLVLG